jgi:hypothetical protein
LEGELLGLLKKICKVHRVAADEASEQRGSYSKVIQAGQDHASPGKTPEAGNPNQLAQKEKFKWLWVS